MIRFADVLLLKAECLIETGDLAGGEALVNQVRARAANPAGWVADISGVGYAANYKISQYPAGFFSDVATARKALYFERKLELGMEGHRWFDLNRWGITQTELARALAYEKTMQWGLNCYGDAVVGPNVMKYPIPQRQIDLSVGRLTQN